MIGSAYGGSGVTKIHGRLVLQKYRQDGWTKVKECEKTVNARILSISDTKVVKSGKFRVKGVYTFYSGKKSEQVTKYSDVVKC